MLIINYTLLITKIPRRFSNSRGFSILKDFSYIILAN